MAPDARFVLASTGNVYASNLDRPAGEDDRITTANAYAASKLAVEVEVEAEAELRDSGLTCDRAVSPVPLAHALLEGVGTLVAGLAIGGPDRAAFA